MLRAVQRRLFHVQQKKKQQQQRHSHARALDHQDHEDEVPPAMDDSTNSHDYNDFENDWNDHSYSYSSYNEDPSASSTLFDETFYANEAANDQVESAASARPPPASDEVLVKLPYTLLYPHNRHLLKHKDAPCNVCLEPLGVGSIGVSRLPCGHVYHIHCAVAWLSRVGSCPTCRYELPFTDPQKEADRVERMKDRPTYTCSCPPSAVHHVCFFVDDENEDNQEENKSEKDDDDKNDENGSSNDKDRD